MEDNIIQNYIKNCEEEYKEFLGITIFPSYEIFYKDLTLEKAERKGFDSWATALYNVSTGKHSLEIWNKIHTLGSIGKYIVFHELTHILDDEKFVGTDSKQYVANHGYAEYHASQVELMQLLGAKHQNDEIRFSKNDMLDTFGGRKTVKEFTEFPNSIANDLINRKDFPVDIETLKTTLGLIFNYYGRRSICKMYAPDYADDIDSSIIAKLIYPQTVEYLNAFMIGWFDNCKVSMINQLYFRMIISLIQKYHLE